MGSFFSHREVKIHVSRLQAPPHVSRTQLPTTAPLSPRTLLYHVWLRLQMSACEKGKVSIAEAQLLAPSYSQLNLDPLDVFQGGWQALLPQSQKEYPETSKK